MADADSRRNFIRSQGNIGRLTGALDAGNCPPGRLTTVRPRALPDTRASIPGVELITKPFAYTDLANKVRDILHAPE